ncbi:hypothetical protein Barb6_02050 [Bacteroidales bacterium Barb6]|nr:hypothetical protein Barb6_02050 [Bacteroidales bacterium Barb6]
MVKVICMAVKFVIVVVCEIMIVYIQCTCQFPGKCPVPVIQGKIPLVVSGRIRDEIRQTVSVEIARTDHPAISYILAGSFIIVGKSCCAYSASLVPINGMASVVKYQYIIHAIAVKIRNEHFLRFLGQCKFERNLIKVCTLFVFDYTARIFSIILVLCNSNNVAFTIVIDVSGAIYRHFTVVLQIVLKSPFA